LTDDGLSIAPYAKPTTTFLYIPPFSMHHPSTMLAWPCNELNRLLILSSDRATYVQAVYDLLIHLRSRGYPLKVLKQIRKQVIDHRHRREIIWSGSKTRDPNVIPIVMTYGDNTGPFRMNHIMQWCKKKMGITNPFIKNMKFVSTWKRKPNLSETLRIRHDELESSRKRRLECEEILSNQQSKRSKSDVDKGFITTNSESEGHGGQAGRD
jgi:hypothetical protein